MTTTRFATCSLCEANCGLAVEVDAGRITRIRGDVDDPMSRGYICPKAVALTEIQNDPDRVRTPLRRRGEQWFAVSWDEALDEAAERFAELQRQHGRDAVAIYFGNPVAHSYAALLVGLGLVGTIGTKNFYTANSIDGHPRMLVSLLAYGSPLAVPIADIDRTEFLLILGANPVVSNGSQLTAPNCKQRLAAIRARGGTIVVVDPRRTETAELADRHHFIVPGTDALLLAALVSTIFEEGLASPGRIAALVAGLDTLPRVLAPFTPERVATAVGMSAATIRELARDFARARSATCYGRLGTCTQEYGSLATWLIDVLNLITGNLDREGGAMFPMPAVDLVSLTQRLGRFGMLGYARYRSRVRGLPELDGELPVAVLAEEMATPGPGQIRGLLTFAGNPVLSCPNGARLDREIGKLEFRVAIDIYRNETTRHADLILPTSFGLEHDHHPLLHHAVAVRNTVKYTRAVVEPPPGVRHDWQVLVELAGRIAARRGLAGRVLGAAARWTAAHYELPRHALAALARIGPRAVRLADVERAPHGIDFGPLTPRLPELLRGRRIQLAPAVLVADLARLAGSLEHHAADRSRELSLVGRRHLRSNNSWMHNTRRLVTGKQRCTVLLHPDDAIARGIAAGELVCVTSRVGSIDVEAQISDEVMRGVACMPHGWGHTRPGTAMAVAREHAGASFNDLSDDMVIDVPSGCAALSGVRVTVERRARAPAPQLPTPTTRGGTGSPPPRAADSDPAARR